MLQRNSTGLLGLVPRQGNQRGAGAHGGAAATARLRSDPACLTLLPWFLWIVNGISLISAAHTVPLEGEKSLSAPFTWKPLGYRHSILSCAPGSWEKGY